MWVFQPEIVINFSMYKKRTFRRKRTIRKRKRAFRRRGSRRNLMQKQVTAGIRMKYTTVFTPKWGTTDEVAQGTISLCGGKGASPGTYYSLTDVNPDSKTSNDMDAYQQFSIYGVAIKWFFAEPTSADASPV